MLLRNRERDALPFTTKDGSEIRELLAYRNSSIRNQSLAEARLPAGAATQEHYHARAEEIYFITAGRALARGLARRHLAYVQNTIIVGAGDVGQLVAKKLRQHPEYGLNLVGFVDGHIREGSRPGRGMDSSVQRPG